jgi:hypothetical protein
LDLARIANRGRRAKSREPIARDKYIRTEDRIRNLIVAAIQDVERVYAGEQPKALSQMEGPFNAHVERVEIEAPTGVSAHADRTVIIVGVAVAIGAA